MALQSEKMGNKPIGKLILTMSLPAMFSMLVQALYNIVDSIYVSGIAGQAGEKSLEAVSIAFPFQMLYMSFALGVGIGASSLISRKLGEGDREQACKIARTGLVLTVLNSVVFVLIGSTVTTYIAQMFTSDPETIGYVVDYLSIVYIFSIGMYVEIFFNKCLQATGNMIVPMFSQLIGAVTNIILDGVFIQTFSMGIKGAAIATVIGQWAAMIFTVIVFFSRKRDVDFAFKGFRLERKTSGSIYAIGLPTIILNSVSSFTMLVMNLMLKNTASGVTVLGVYFKVQSFVFMPVFGLNQGILPIMAFNYGAANRQRFIKTYAISTIAATAICFLGFVVFQLFTEQLLSMYESVKTNAQMMSDGIYAFRIISYSFLPAGLSIITITMFQSLGRGIESMLMSVLRQLVFLLPCAYALIAIAGSGAVWFAYPVAEFAVALIFIPIALLTVKKAFANKSGSAPMLNAAATEK